VSVPCFELFLASPEAERRAVIGDARVKVAVEAGVRQGWDAIIRYGWRVRWHERIWGQRPYKDLYKHFGITSEAVAEAALRRLGKA
jgi:transketolase